MNEPRELELTEKSVAEPLDEPRPRRRKKKHEPVECSMKICHIEIEYSGDRKGARKIGELVGRLVDTVLGTALPEPPRKERQR
ncbi:MAG: hypothetical protein AB7G12_12620 [Thermoanaerobaculia bacterium]